MSKRAFGSASVRDMTYIAIFVVLLAVCAWISVPLAVPFTLQTFGIFCASGMLAGKRATVCVLVYIALGLVGIPVFSGFLGGAGVLAGPTGGYIVGFIFTALIYWLVTSLFGDGAASMAAGMALGLAACYAFGTGWFMFAYARQSGPIGLMGALGYCVFPFILPDMVKLSLAVLLCKTLGPRLRIYKKQPDTHS